MELCIIVYWINLKFLPILINTIFIILIMEKENYIIKKYKMNFVICIFK